MNGIFPLNKPIGITSHTATSKFKRLTKEKAGHSGTLDPLAEGVLPILIGNCTRLADYLDGDKCYIAVVKLGIETDTGDITGKITDEKPFINIKKDDILNLLPKFIGEIKQIPPMYSAIKIGGKKLYELARQGIEIERKEREITINYINLLSNDEEKGEYEIEVSCSKGTYIRTLVMDIGLSLGTVATMLCLKRTKAANIKIENCFSFEEIEGKDIGDYLISAEKMFEHLNKITIPDDGLKYYLNGGSIAVNRVQGNLDGNIFLAYSENNDFLGLAGIKNDEVKVVWKN